MANGIDVSEWQGEIDWSKVKTDFVIIRAGYGKKASQVDKYFEQNYNGCKANNIPCGVYWYSYAESPEDAKQEALACLEVIREKQFEYPIYYDIEEQNVLSMGKSAVSDIIRTFLDIIEKDGCFVGLYMSANALESYVESEIREKYTVWVANYDVPKPNYSGKYGMWQKSAKGSMDGINGDVDINESFENYPDIISNAKLNGFGKSHRITLVIDGETIIDNYRF